MKKVYSILIILAATAGFTNCSKADLIENKEAGNGGAVVYATTDTATRTTLTSDFKVLWSTGDQIKFIKDENTTTTYTFTLSSGSGSTNGTFTCAETPADGTYTVYYPATYDGTNWPAQTYVSATDISGAPMKATATVSGGKVSDISFTNEGGILRYTVKGSGTIRTINVKSGTSLNVTLACGITGVGLTAEGAVFNIAVPAGTYSNAILKFTATDNTVATKSARSFTVTKNMVSLATFEANALSFVEAVVPTGFVDLGVTNSFGNPLYWAECNLGSTKADAPGDYYMWGATALMYSAVDYTKQDGAFTFVTENPYGDKYKNTWDASQGFNWNNIPFTDGVYNSANKNVFTKYTTDAAYAKSGSPDNLTILKSEDDAATAKNSNWRIPTKDEFAALAANCVLVWTADYNGTGKSGDIVYKAKNEDDKGKADLNGWKMWDASNLKFVPNTGSEPTGYTTSDTHIFLPAAGQSNKTSLAQYSNFGAYWSSTLASDNNSNAIDFGFTYGSAQIYSNTSRYRGYSVRPVSD